MKFWLFSKVQFKVSDPVALIESYCFQSNFFKNYDLLLINNKGRKITDVNKIGARINRSLFKKCKRIISDANNLCIFKDDLDVFLKNSNARREKNIRELNDKVVKKLLKIPGMGLSKATKVLHTLYPNIIPMLDDPLQMKYQIWNPSWTVKKADEILISYYENMEKGGNLKNLNRIYNKIDENLKCLTKVRMFDILWWSYLKAESLKQENKNIKWTTIK
ncbi:MAG TPA: hypothetical protein QF468_00275 [Nitrospinota bacterium]|jgi:hypothetical protein|nr:hypothetical protein [Nitrospinota bacterium]|tara:strand:+ start:240 stop:896 length:657 start_codon:yes stop_codon:yes gene_type:complete